MLQPSNRLTLIDSLRPPAGYSFDAAMAVTFTLDLRALLAAPAALALHREVGDGESDALLPVDVLHAIRTHAGNITVFCQAGSAAVPPPEKVFSFLEGTVIPVIAPGGGVVHPKVWVIRYRDHPGPDTKLRVIVASRNLTFDPSWDTVIRLDEAVSNGCDLSPVGDLFEGLCGSTVDALEEAHVDRVASLCVDLRQRSFAKPAGIKDVRAHVFGFSAATSPFPARVDRSLVISPFLSAGFFNRFYPHPVTTVVSRPDSLFEVVNVTTIHERFWFDDGSSDDDAGDALGPARPLRGLHAKAFAFEVGATTYWFLGSANATSAAFGSNVEILLELTGSTTTIGIDEVCGGYGDDIGLKALFRNFDPDGESGPADDEVSLLLDRVGRALASLKVTAQAVESENGWAVTYATEELIDLPGGIAAAVWPSTIPGSRRGLVTGQRLDATFTTTLEAISSFLAVELVMGEKESRFCIPVRIAGLPDDRDAHLMRSLIGNTGRFFAYLVALLADADGNGDLLDDLTAVTWGDETWSAGVTEFGTPPVLERMLRAMRTDPSKLMGIRPLVQALEADDVLPPAFIELWLSVLAIANSRV
jgi:hypothetical protein